MKEGAARLVLDNLSLPTLHRDIAAAQSGRRRARCANVETDDDGEW